jgi:hypothetical protein
MRKFAYREGHAWTTEAPLMGETALGELKTVGEVSGMTYLFCDQGFLVYGAENRDAVSILTQRNRVKLKAKSPEDKVLAYFFQSLSDWGVIPVTSLELVAEEFAGDDGTVETVRKTLLESCGYCEDGSGDLVHLDFRHAD